MNHTVRTIATGEYSCTCGRVWDRDEGDDCPDSVMGMSAERSKAIAARGREAIIAGAGLAHQVSKAQKEIDTWPDDIRAQHGLGPRGVVPPGVLAECFFHDLPDEDDWEVHDPRHMSGDCDGCVQAVIVSRTDWERLNPSPVSVSEDRAECVADGLSVGMGQDEAEEFADKVTASAGGVDERAAEPHKCTCPKINSVGKTGLCPIHDASYIKNQQARAALTASAPNEDWGVFASYLLDKCEGDTISEEGLQRALHSMYHDPHYGALFRGDKASAPSHSERVREVVTCSDCNDSHWRTVFDSDGIPRDEKCPCAAPSAGSQGGEV